MARDAVIGLDIGTTSTKAVLYDLSGRALVTAQQAINLLTPQPAWAEQDPEELWRSVIAGITLEFSCNIPVWGGCRPVTIDFIENDGFEYKNITIFRASTNTYRLYILITCLNTIAPERC